MRLLKMEMRKIIGRPVLNVVFLVIVGFMVFSIVQAALEQRTEIDKKVYHGLEAIQKDKELVKKYDGIWTMEKAEEIVRKYGYAGYNEEYIRREGNYCNQFVTDEMTDYRQTEKLPEGFYQGQDFENNVSYLVNGTVKFGYVEGWKSFQDYLGIVNRLMCLYMILMIASVFSEEYSLKTVNILLTAFHGKKRDIWMKIAASLLWCTIVYIGAVLLILLAHISCYGMDGLKASAELITTSVTGQSVLFYLMASVLAGLAGNLLNVCIMLFISSRCNQSVKAVITGTAVYFLPYIIWTTLINGALADFVQNTYGGMLVGKVIGIMCNSFPYYLCWLPDMWYPGNIIVWIYITAAALTAGGICLAYKSYRDYQVLI